MNRRLKIGIVAMGLETADDFRMAGVARYAYGLLDAIAKGSGSQHDFEFFLLPSFEIPESWRGAANITFHRTWKRYNKWMLLAAGVVAARHRLDFLLSTANTIPILGSVPAGVFIHDLFPLEHPEWFPESTAAVNKKTIPPAVSGSRLVFTNSEHTKSSIVRLLGASSEKVVATPLAAGNPVERVDEDKIDWSSLHQLGVASKRFVLTLSTIEPRKNLGLVFEAFARAKASPALEGVTLVVAGSKGWKYEAALARIEELGLTDSVSLLGYVPDELLPHLFSACELYLCASLSEGFGMPLVEAMTAGCPVLSSNGGALPEVGGDAVRYFDPTDVASLEEALVQALSSPESRASWSAKSCERARVFSWAMTADATVAAIERLSL